MHRSGGTERIHNNEHESSHEGKLEGLLAMLSQDINAEAYQKHGLLNLVETNGRLNMQGYNQAKGGMFPQENLEADLRDVRQAEINFSRANIERVKEHYKNVYGIEGEDAIIAKWKELREKQASHKTEIAVTILFQKMLKGKFMVVRSSVYDDYRNHVDSLILNKETGEAMCALDEAHDEGDGEKIAEKSEKTKAILKKGGGMLRYGLKMHQGKLQRTGMKQMPVFHLGLTTEQLDSLVSSFKPNSSDVSETEKDIFAQLIVSLRKQKAEYEQLDLNPNLKGKIVNLEKLLNEFEQIALS